jgi:hypothetical protein
MARVLGILGLLGILASAFHIGYVQPKLIVAGDAAGSPHNILTHQDTFRSGTAAHIFELLFNVLGEVIGLLLLGRVNVIIAGFSLCCGCIGVAIEACRLLAAYLPLQVGLAGGLGFSAPFGRNVVQSAAKGGRPHR